MLIGYARVSTIDQNTDLQTDALKTAGCQKIFIDKISGVKSDRPELNKLKEQLREGDTLVVWRLDRWGRSLPDLVITLRELTELGVGFVSLAEALDLTTPTGRAMAGMLAVFAEFERDILRDRVKAGLAQARQEGRSHGRPATVRCHAYNIRKLHQEGVSKSEIARRLSVSRTSVRRLLEP